VSRQKRKRRRRTTAPPVPPRAPRRTVAAPVDERPKAPWHPFPLVELCVLVGLVMLVVGFLTRDHTRGRLLIVFGFTLGSLGGLDTTVREHFSGYRSHSLTLAAIPALAAATALAVARAPWIAVPIALATVFGLAFIAARRVFERQTGRTPA
jgi:hypothetical protein